MPQMTVAVVGAGIAGLTLAAALRRADIDVHVYERAPQLSEVGAGVQLAPNATRLLHRLGLGARLREISVAPEAIEIHRWDDGALLQRTLLGERCRRRFGAPYYTVHRADLHSALLSLVPSGRVHLAARCTAVSQTADAARLHLADGTTVEADLVVGADGIHSVVRDALVPDRPRYSGQTIYRGLVPAERVPYLLVRPRVRLWFGPGRHCVCYPVSSGRQVSFGATVAASDWQQESWSARGSVDDLMQAYTGWHEDVTRLIGAAEVVSRWALHDRDSISVLAHGRVTLVGDAAHPMLPFRAQGANQAIEDAAALAGCLAGAGSKGIAAALRHYERVRLPRTSRLQQESRDSVRTFHLADGAAQQDRDAAGSVTAGPDPDDWLFGYDAEQAVAVRTTAETPV
ncbi:FAD-dependent monooxygenase [Actinoplanes xinjiangensis]|uniref:Salicylate hydroxylase n=1 Tax=Actinoplanes xinjiangensis TaxID=512350 RepID=A0A316EUQ6_9ACTN|nr:FAD-dependent monooxygenase [Actinoplanes xinjiangensis]PWK36051.1 salicylate hydroxylase [Actinoplanes xinjiangensis]GIF42947.1 salicylate hydroxylase [Actinoplanes xinjiangensis]